jgi:hypothetical protein
MESWSIFEDPAAYLDANYGGVLSLLPCRYGLVKPLRTSNPVLFNLMASGDARSA